MVNLAWRMIAHDLLRFAITISGVAFAVALALFQIGLFNGLLKNASVTIEQADAELWVTSKNTPNVDFSHEFSEMLVERVRAIPGVERADNLIVWFMPVTLPSGTKEGMVVYALENFVKWGLPKKVLEGELEDLRRGPYLFLDDSATQRFGPFAVGEYREIVGTRLKIVGRTEGVRSFTTTPVAFVNYRVAQNLLPTILRGNTTYILVKLCAGANASVVQRAISARLPFNDVHTQQDWATKSRRYWILNTGLGFNLGLTVLLGCIVGVIVVGQTLYTSAMEHSVEFGTIKAIGGSNFTIYALLLKQAALSGVLGFGLGLALTFAIRPLIELGGLSLLIGRDMALLVFVVTELLCVAATLLSFQRIARTEPALVFRS
jgi:putative ABC transport system permease protein